jgi:hypothetical protein
MDCRIDSTQLVAGDCVLDPSGYGPFVLIFVEITQIVGIQRTSGANDVSECVTFDGVNPAVRVLPKPSYAVHLHGDAPSF